MGDLGVTLWCFIILSNVWKIKNDICEDTGSFTDRFQGTGRGARVGSSWWCWNFSEQDSFSKGGFSAKQRGYSTLDHSCLFPLTLTGEMCFAEKVTEFLTPPPMLSTVLVVMRRTHPYWREFGGVSGWRGAGCRKGWGLVMCEMTLASEGWGGGSGPGLEGSGAWTELLAGPWERGDPPGSQAALCNWRSLILRETVFTDRVLIDLPSWLLPP